MKPNEEKGSRGALPSGPDPRKPAPAPDPPGAGPPGTEPPRRPTSEDPARRFGWKGPPPRPKR
ncbi:MAG: hypothetical protein DHS20C21_13370 [Gemmatimonadota bacterium]|nr:MAG: hypothetical protein DHS20C21_13370 [Gemmatimonadota bacterium]